MPEDLLFEFDWDSSGDADIVDGKDFYYQHALLLGLSVAYDFRGSALTQTDIIELEDQIKDTMAASPYFDEPINVSISSIEDERITMDVEAKNVSQFEIVV